MVESRKLLVGFRRSPSTQELASRHARSPGSADGSVKDGTVTAFIAATDPKLEMPEGVTVDKDGHVFGGFTADTDVKEYVKN